MNREVIVLTGATGFLGSHLMAELLTRGHRLFILGRAAGGEPLEKRIRRLLGWFGIDYQNVHLETAEVGLADPLLGLDQQGYKALCAQGCRIIHCASDTRFSEQNRLESTRANVDCVKGMLTFAKDSSARFFYYVSTAYVAPCTSPLCLEAPVDGADFANVYEETKAQAEREVASRCLTYGIPFAVLRPSVVYGDARNGRANGFNALYYHVRALYYIREIYMNDLLNHSGRKSREWDIYLDDKEILHLPLRIFLKQRGQVNLIPIDYFVHAVSSLMETAEAGNVYHITSDEPKTTEELAAYCESFLKINGVHIVYNDQLNGHPPNPPEALFNKFIEPYRPYLSDTRIFDRSNTNRATGGLYPPELTYDIFERSMNYAVKANWGNGKRTGA